MENKISSFLLKPNSSEEKLYCKKYNVHLERLSNGVTILGIPCKKDFSSWARIKYTFSAGAYGNHPGAVHFLEHFINKKVRWIAEHNSLSIRAATDQLETEDDVSGVANPKFRDYGLWKVLDGIRKSLESPLTSSSDVDKLIEIEKNIIKTEIKKRESDFDLQSEKHLRRVVFSSKNPFRDEPMVTGEEHDVENLTRDILEKIEAKIFNAKNLLISFYTEGDISISRTILEELQNQFSHFPSGEQNKLDRKLLEEIDLTFKQGHIYSHELSLKNGLVATEFVWIMNHEPFSSKYFGFTILKQVLSTELFDYSRKMGWGYFTGVKLTRPTDNITIIRLRIDSRKNHPHDFSDGIQKILTAAKQIAKDVVENENKRQLATPMSVVNRLSWAVDGIKDHGAMIDADKVRQAMLEVTDKDLTDLLDEMLATNPAIIITGDLTPHDKR